MENIDVLEKKLKYTFKSKNYLINALTHSSYVNEHKLDRRGCNERLEFLGDAVLGFVAAEFLFKKKPTLAEGQMTRLRAELVCEKSLYNAARSIDLGAYLRIGKGEESSGARERPSILADAMEAAFAAVFLDGGRRAVEKIIHELILSKAESTPVQNNDFKTALQEHVQKKPGVAINYRVVSEEGPDHMKVFSVEVDVGGKVCGRGEGASKKAAEQSAARDALYALGKKE